MTEGGLAPLCPVLLPASIYKWRGSLRLILTLERPCAEGPYQLISRILRTYIL